MKKIYNHKRGFVAITVLLLLLFVACLQLNPAPSLDTIAKNESLAETDWEMDVDTFFRIVELESTHTSQYQYQILDQSGRIVFEETVLRHYPAAEFIDANTLRVRIGAGTYAFSDRYYDVKRNVVSDVFNTPYDAINQMVISVLPGQEPGTANLIIEEMFNTSIVLLSESIQCYYHAIPILAFQSIGIDENEVTATYFIDADGSTEKAVFVLHGR